MYARVMRDRRANLSEATTTKAGKLATTIPVRLPRGEVARLDALADRAALSRSTLLRAALRLGLDRLEADPAALLGGDQGAGRATGRRGA